MAVFALIDHDGIVENLVVVDPDAMDTPDFEAMGYTTRDVSDGPPHIGDKWTGRKFVTADPPAVTSQPESLVADRESVRAAVADEPEDSPVRRLAAAILGE